ncbi:MULTISPECIES: alpha/beta fold hydrolase [unclassified Rathayibacter]|uniref:alpha/beta hydrolase family protein n=1 Tax=unclassified Rathayibacter TaxID=2609250 RepID=UPI001051363A|nr:MULTISPECIES: alpha/beta fold hydrolase [unclassified Rathayibacter]TCL82586.1 chlorophyllase-like protein [Rathayibacter sp. PhB192]TCM27925.1 chlorophyllase-like protein [Rathayibacter sp. PhB179]
MTSTVPTSLPEVLPEAVPVVSVAPVELDAPGRPVPLTVRISAPTTGTDLPVVLFSHGNGWNHDGYAPLTAYWASRGFVVIQPTHLDSRRHGFGFDHPVFPTIWEERIADLTRVLDRLDVLEAAVPGLAGRVDSSRIAVAGHSWGAQTAQTLLGARIVGEDGSLSPDRSDRRVRAGVLLAATGVAGDDLEPFAQAAFPFLRPSFAQLSSPTLVVAGDRDQSRLSRRGPDWFTDAYTQSPGATDLLTLHGGEHSLGGIVGEEVAETTDADPARLSTIQQLTTAYLRTALGVDVSSWSAARAAFREDGREIGRIDSE